MVEMKIKIEMDGTEIEIKSDNMNEVFEAVEAIRKLFGEASKIEPSTNPMPFYPKIYEPFWVTVPSTTITYCSSK